MTKLSGYFEHFRKTTPRYIQWVLLIAALVLVVLLFVLLANTKPRRPDITDEDMLQITPELVITQEPIDWSNVFVGDTETATVRVNANTEGLIKSIALANTNISGLGISGTCTNAIVSQDKFCEISIEYTPPVVMARTQVGIDIDWYATDSDAEISSPDAIKFFVGANARPQPKPEPKPEPAPRMEPKFELPDLSSNFEEPEDDSFLDDFDLQDDLDDIVPNVKFDDAAPVSPAKKISVFGTGCSDFAFPGYNLAGVQSGWIKPVGGSYHYYPLSNIDCSGTPAGIYNAQTGFIMDFNNLTKKIGSDAEHIRYAVQTRVPHLGSASARKPVRKAMQLDDLSNRSSSGGDNGEKVYRIVAERDMTKNVFKGYSDSSAVVSSRPYDRSFVLRQYKPIPATIVSDIQADPQLLETGVPVRATVDRNVYSDNGRTVILPTGTLMLGYVSQKELPGPYKAVGRLEINWYQFIRPDGVEFNFTNSGKQPFSADSQGRKGVPGHGSTDYLQQFVMPMLTAIVPAAVNMIAPISDAFVNQIDLDNNTVVQTGTVRSSELAKNEIITAWNNVATKLLVDMMGNTTPPFSVAAGTRITVYSPVDLLVTCGQEDGDTRKCAIMPYDDEVTRFDITDEATGYVYDTTDEEAMIGQIRSLMKSSLKERCCADDCGENEVCGAKEDWRDEPTCKNYDFATLDFYCRSFGTYSAKNNAKQKALWQNQKDNAANIQKDSKEYNQQVLGIKYQVDEEGNETDVMVNPFQKNKSAPAQTEILDDVCGNGGGAPDANGCCPGETLTDMGEQGVNCCPDAGGDCFPPVDM